MTALEFVNNYHNLDEETKSKYMQTNAKTLLKNWPAIDGFIKQLSEIMTDYYFYIVDELCDKYKDRPDYEDIKSVASLAFCKAIHKAKNYTLDDVTKYFEHQIETALTSYININNGESLIVKRLTEVQNELVTNENHLVNMMISKENDHQLLQDLQKVLPEKDFYILASYFGIIEKKNQMKLAQELNCRQTTVSMIIQRSLKKCYSYYTKSPINSNGRISSILTIITIKNILTDDELKSLNIHTPEEMDKALLDAINASLSGVMKEIMLSKCNFKPYLSNEDISKKYEMSESYVYDLIKRSKTILKTYLLSKEIVKYNLPITHISIRTILGDDESVNAVLKGRDEKEVLRDAIEACLINRYKEIALSLAGFYGDMSDKEIADKYGVQLRSIPNFKRKIKINLENYLKSNKQVSSKIDAKYLTTTDINIAIKNKAELINADKTQILIDSINTCLNEQEKAIILPRFGLAPQKNQSEFAQEFDMSISTVCVMGKGAMKKLYDYIVNGKISYVPTKYERYKDILTDLYINNLSKKEIKKMYNISSDQLRHIIQYHQDLLDEKYQEL